MAAGRTLCLDVGERRVGVAISDEEGRLASPLDTIVRREGGRELQRIAELARREEVARVVVGLPRTLRGEIGPQARRVQRWAERLRSHLAVPLLYWDERYSTAEAIRRLEASGAKRARLAAGRGLLDAAAAAVILQDYLDARS